MTQTHRQTHRQSVVERSGPWPFISRKRILRADGNTDELQSRHVRKGLHYRRHHVRADLNQWIGAIFALGAALFGAASGLSLMPQIAQQLALNDADINALFFAGSIPFTTAAYLQLFQAANAPVWEHPASGKSQYQWFGWRPRDIGWLSCVLQFAGTILFNINTFYGMRTDLSWVAIDLLVWVPDLTGSLLFLSSGYLAFVEVCHRHLAWLPASINWWITLLNLAGCVAFMIAAIYSFIPPGGEVATNSNIAIAFTLAGALGFLSGSLLMLAE